MCSVKVVFFFVLVQLLSDVYCQRQNKFFREDYKFIESTEAFYKIHTIHRSWKDAKKACAAEGATLFYPEDQLEANEVLKIMNTTTDFHWVYVGISDVLSRGVFKTIDGRAMNEVYNNWAEGEPTAIHPKNCVFLRREGILGGERCEIRYPFACKKTLASLQWNDDCNMPNMDYKYDEAVNKCYKFHLNPLNWTDAFAACSNEQSYLAIIKSQQEADTLVNITAEAPKDNIQGNYLRGAVHLGFHNMDDEGWVTIQDIPLSQSGYANWGYTQPDGKGEEKCGSFFYTGQLNDIGCEQRMFFICEHEPPLRTTSTRNPIDDTNDEDTIEIDFRFNNV